MITPEERKNPNEQERSPQCGVGTVNGTHMATVESVQNDIIRLLGAKIETDLTLTGETNIVADTGLDSVSVMDFVFELEDEFGITVPLDRISDVKTVGQLAETVHGLILENA